MLAYDSGKLSRTHKVTYSVIGMNARRRMTFKGTREECGSRETISDKVKEPAMIRRVASSAVRRDSRAYILKDAIILLKRHSPQRQKSCTC